jgi:hypothetical protein
MIITEYEHWLVVRQSRRRRIYRDTLVATVSRTLRTPLGARARKRGGFMQLRWFHIRGVCIAPGCVYRSSSAKRGMGIPGDHVKRVETHHSNSHSHWAHGAALERRPRASLEGPPWAFGTGQRSIVPTSYMLGPEVHASVTCVGFTNNPHSIICRKATRLVSPWHATCNTAAMKYLLTHMILP